MRKYTLSINIQSESKELLENLMITLETVNDDMRQLDSVELLAVSGPSCIDYSVEEKTSQAHNNSPSDTQRCLFLDNWVIAEGN